MKPLTSDSCLARLLEAVGAEREQLVADTLATIRDVFGISVTERPEHRSDGTCAVDGSYFHSPPRIVIAAAESPRRCSFTALHEFAHHLVRHDWELFGLALDRALEEEVCDRFAAEILCPQTMADRILTSPVPTAMEFAALFRESGGSRAVCARRVAARLPCVGHAVVALGTMVTYCASAHTPSRAEFGVEQGEDSIFGAAVRDGSAEGLSRFLYATRTLSPRFWGDAMYEDEHVFAVFVEEGWIRDSVDLGPDTPGPRGVL